MDRLDLSTDGGRLTFAPGEEIRGRAAWELTSPPDSVTLHLLWYTEGRGTQDVGIVATLPFVSPGPNGDAEFAFRLPPGPLSFSGQLITLAWALELVVQSGDPAGEHSRRLDLLVTSSGREIRLAKDADEKGADGADAVPERAGGWGPGA